MTIALNTLATLPLGLQPVLRLIDENFAALATAVSGPLTLTTLTIEPPVNTTTQALVINQTSPITGTTQGEFRFNEINVTSAVQVLPGSPSTLLPFGDNVAAGLKITMDAGANAGGFQIPLLVRYNHTVATQIWGAADNNFSDHIVFAVQGSSSAADTSASNTGAGYYGISAALWFDAGAKHSNMCVFNPDINLDAAATVQYVVGIRLQRQGLGSGSVGDAAITTFTNASGVGWTNFVTFSESHDAQSIKSTGNVFNAAQSLTVANFADLSNMTVSGSILKFPRVNLTGGGVLVLNPNTVAIGSTPTPGAGVVVQVVTADSVAGAIELETFGSGAAVVPIFRGARSRGTAATRTAVQADDALVTYGGSGYDGTTINPVSGGMSVFAAENFGASANGTYLTFATTPTGSTTAVTRARISATGIFTVTQNTVTPPAPLLNSLLQIAGADSTTANIEINTYGSGATVVPIFRGQRSRGTAASRSAVQADDALATFGGAGYDGSAYNTSSGAISIFAAETFSGSARGAYLTFATTTNGAALATTRGAIENDGGLTWPRAVTGGSKGSGTINATELWQANVRVATLSGSEALTNKTYNGNTWTAGTGTLTIAAGKTATHNATTTFAGTDGKTVTFSNTLTFSGTDSSSIAFGTGGTVAYTANNLSVFASTTSAQLAGVLSDETGSSGGVVVFSASPTIATPTFTTSHTSPIHIGGTTASSTNTIQSTSGTGTSDAIIFQTGSQVERGRINTSGQWQIGPNFAPTTGVRLAINANTVAPQATTNEAGTVLQLTNADATGTRIVIDAFVDNATKHPSITYRTSRGTQNSPTATQNGDFLGSNFGKGRGNAGDYLTGAGAGFIFVSTENHTTTGGARIDLYATEIGTSAVTNVARFDKPTTATQTALSIWDVDNAALERVTIGAADSAGAGFKVLRIPN